MENSRFKFRAWNKIAKEMNYQDEKGFIDRCYLGDNGYHQSTANMTNASKVNECYIMQYTGLKDKNGVEIYEGDILNKGSVSFGVDNGSVRMIDGCWMVCRSKEDVHYYNLYHYKDALDIIGNIHQNPELLEK